MKKKRVSYIAHLNCGVFKIQMKERIIMTDVDLFFVVDMKYKYILKYF